MYIANWPLPVRNILAAGARIYDVHVDKYFDDLQYKDCQISN